MTSSDLIVYWGSEEWGSAPCWRVLLAMKEKHVPYQERFISLRRKEQRSVELLLLNPRGQVPIMVADGVVICESLAICHYLEKVYKGQGCQLISDEPCQIARVLQRMHEVETLRRKTVDDFVYYIFELEDNPKDKVIASETLSRRTQSARDELQLWENYLQQEGTSGHIAGKDFSMADVIFFPQLAFLVRAGFSPAPRFPRLAEYYKMVKERASVKSTWPPKWTGQEDFISVLARDL